VDSARLIPCLLAAVASAGAAFLPSVRVDQQNLPSHGCYHAALAVGPGATATKPLYVAIQDDSLAGIVTVRSDIVFQKSTNAGMTWLAQDLLIRRGALFACYPDITTDRNGDVYIVYTEKPANSAGHIYCTSSTDAGNTWSAPAQVDDNSSTIAVGWARIAADDSGNLFAAWNQLQGSYMRIFSSVSTDHGLTWSPRVRVDDDTVPSDCFHTDVAVQPGTRHYLVASTAPYWVRPGYISSHAYFYRSTDQGRTFEPGVQLDTFDYYAGQPHVVADAQHIICDYTGSSISSGNQNITESRTLYTQPDTWGRRVPVADLDTLYSSYYNGAKLALSADGRVHTTLMICDLLNWEYEIYYASSTDHGASWSDRERVNDVTTRTQADPDIGADSSGFAYCTWQDQRNSRDEIWFATNNPLGVTEASPRPQAADLKLTAEPSVFTRTTTIRLSASSLLSPPSSLLVFDASGRLVRSYPVRASSFPLSTSDLPSGTYVLRFGPTTARVTLLPIQWR
jgi:hypothetical protein